MRKPLHIRGKVLGGVLLILLPVLVLLLFGIVEYHQVRRDSILQGQLQTVETAGLLVDGALRANRELAKTIAAADEVSDLDAARSERFFRRIAAGRPELLNLTLLRLDGTPMASLQQVPGKLDVSDREYFRAVVETNQPVLSDILLGRTLEVPVAAAAAPVLQGDGALRAVAVVGFRVNMMRALLEDVKLREGQEIFVTDPHGRLAFHSAIKNPAWEERDLSQVPEIRSALEGEAVQSSRFRGVFEGDRRIAAVAASPEHGWIVGVTWRSRSAFADLNAIWATQVVAFLAIAAFAVAGAWGLSRYLGSRLHRLVELARALGRGELSERALPVARGGDEIDELTAVFSDVAAALIRERTRRETFIASIAHDLRNLTTPLTVTAQLLTRPGVVAEETRTRMAGRLGQQTRRVQRLVADLLDANQLEAGEFDLVIERPDLVSLLHAVAEEQRQLAPDHQIHVEAPDQLFVEGDAQRLMQVFTNLVNNAVKYSPAGGEVRVALAEEDGAAHVRVTDHGIGMTAAELGPVFEAYTRATGSAKAIRGLGLGLFISKGIVEAHGGEIRAESEGEGKGSTFFVTLPLRRPDAPRG